MIEKLLNQFPAVGKCKNLIGRPGPTVVGVELVDDVSGNLVLVGGQPQKIVVNLIFKINNKFDFGIIRFSAVENISVFFWFKRRHFVLP